VFCATRSPPHEKHFPNFQAINANRKWLNVCARTLCCINVEIYRIFRQLNRLTNALSKGDCHQCVAVVLGFIAAVISQRVAAVFAVVAGCIADVVALGVAVVAV